MFDTGVWGSHTWKLMCTAYSCLKRERQVALEQRPVLEACHSFFGTDQSVYFSCIQNRESTSLVRFNRFSKLPLNLFHGWQEVGTSFDCMSTTLDADPSSYRLFFTVFMGLIMGYDLLFAWHESWASST
jgi:hypothetical protein